MAIDDVVLNSNVPKSSMEKYISNMQSMAIDSSEIYPDDLYGDIEISINASDREIEELASLRSGTRVIVFDPERLYDRGYYSRIHDIIDVIESSNNKIILEFKINKRSLFNESQISLRELKNTTLCLEVDREKYSLNEYLYEEQYLYNLVEEYTDSKYTPFEKFLFVYNFVKNYKPYKDNPEEPKLARNMKYILVGDYMVCSGYAKLLVTLLDKVGIDSFMISVGVDNSYENGFDISNTPINIDWHARVLINIKDNKYNLNGIYVSDPTWDNSENYDLYNHFLNTIDSMQKSNMLFTLEDIDLILDIHSFDEYTHKINELLKRMMKDNSDAPDYESQLFWSYEDLFDLILRTISLLDYNKYEDEYLQYLNVQRKYRDEQFYTDVITKAGYYFVSKTNKYISVNKKVIMLISAMRKINGFSKLETKRFEEYIKNSVLSGDKAFFPYEFEDGYEGNKLRNK